jgi:hypothetical protein
LRHTRNDFRCGSCLASGIMRVFPHVPSYAAVISQSSQSRILSPAGGKDCGTDRAFWATGGLIGYRRRELLAVLMSLSFIFRSTEYRWERIKAASRTLELSPQTRDARCGSKVGKLVPTQRGVVRKETSSESASFRLPFSQQSQFFLIFCAVGSFLPRFPLTELGRRPGGISKHQAVIHHGSSSRCRRHVRQTSITNVVDGYLEDLKEEV